MTKEIEQKLINILQQIEEKKRLILLTKSKAGTPFYKGGISYEKATKTIQNIYTDIFELENEFKRIEPFGDSINTSTLTNKLINRIELTTQIKDNFNTHITIILIIFLLLYILYKINF